MSRNWNLCAPKTSDLLKIKQTLPSELQSYFDAFLDPSFCSPELIGVFARWLQPVYEQLPKDLKQEEADAFADAIMQEALNRLASFIEGIKMYQTHPAMRENVQGVEVVWQKGNTRLWDYAPEAKDAPVVFVVPSLVNRFDILDVEPDRSFLRYLAKRGLRPLVIDWGKPNEEETGFFLSDYMRERLLPLLNIVQENADGQPIHLLGYCMGGVLALALAQMKESVLSSLTLMATPWDFAVKGIAGVPSYNTWMGKFFLNHAVLWEPYLSQMGCLPAPLLQNIFTTYQPLQILQKYMSLASLPKEDARTCRFVLTEDWLNNGVALAWPVAQECLHSWYKNNDTGNLKWSIDGVTIDPRKLSLPTYLLVPQKDRIVPPESALVFRDLIPNISLHEPDMGHVGVMAGDRAEQEVWGPLVKWIKTKS